MDPSLLQHAPLIFRNDSILSVKNRMSRSGLPELPVLENSKLLGTITAKGIVGFLKKSFEIESLVAHHLLERDFILLDLSLSISELAKEFVRKGRVIACIERDAAFLGYVVRARLLSLLFEREDPIAPFISKKCKTIREDYGIKKIVRALREELPIVVRNKAPMAAFSPHELYFLIFINDFLLRKAERDFETLRAEKRKFLRLRLNQQLLSLRKRELDSFLPPFKISDIAKPLLIEESSSIAEAAKLMAKSKRSCLAVSSGGVITDLDLLKALI